jgi:hypothetical protein
MVQSYPLDMLIGLAVGIVGVAAVVGLGFKMKVIRLNGADSPGYPPNCPRTDAACQGPEFCPEHLVERERSLQNQKHITELFAKMDAFKDRTEKNFSDVKSAQMGILIGLIQGGHIPKSALPHEGGL